MVKKKSDRQFKLLAIIIAVIAIGFPSLAFGEDDSGGHQWGDWIITKEPTCISVGYKYRICNKFPNSPHKEEAVIPKTSQHTYETSVTPASCTDPEITIYTCKYCGDSYEEVTAEPLGHNYGEWEIATKASIEQPGVKAKICQNNPSHILTATIPAMTASKSLPEDSNGSGINKLDIVLSLLCILISGSFSYTIKQDLNVMGWSKKLKSELLKEMYR